jgi:hypothetical protein
MAAFLYARVLDAAAAGVPKCNRLRRRFFLPSPPLLVEGLREGIGANSY